MSFSAFTPLPLLSPASPPSGALHPPAYSLPSASCPPSSLPPPSQPSPRHAHLVSQRFLIARRVEALGGAVGRDLGWPRVRTGGRRQPSADQPSGVGCCRVLIKGKEVVPGGRWEGWGWRGVEVLVLGVMVVLVRCSLTLVTPLTTGQRPRITRPRWSSRSARTSAGLCFRKTNGQAWWSGLVWSGLVRSGLA